MLATATVIATTGRLIAPLISDLYKGAKKAGANGLDRWDASTFPKKLARKLRVIEEVRTLWKPDQEVSLLDFYHPPKVRVGNQAKPLNRLSDLGPGNFVIEGIVGQGKSILLRHLAMQEIVSNDARSLPVFLELRSLTSKFGLIEAINAQLANFDVDIDEETLQFLCRSGRICFLLDGFDELDDSLVKETLTLITNYGTKFPELQIIITSRPGNEIQKCTSFKMIRIAGLGVSDYSPFLLKLGLDSIKITQIKEAIRKSPSNVSELITTPLMLTLVVMVYESEKEIPETLPEFFDRLFRVVFSRHDKLKAAFNRKHHSGLSERRLQELFEAFCFMAMQNSFTRSLSHKQFQIAFDEALQYSENCKCEMEAFKQDLTKVACLMLEEGLDTTTFLHKSIMEYYAAAFIAHSMDEVASLFYKGVQESSRPWWEVLSFLKNIDPYRFARDFEVIELETIQNSLLNPLTSRKDADLVKQIKSIHPQLGVELGEETDNANNMRIITFGHFSAHHCMSTRILDDLLMNALDATIPKSIDRTMVIDLARKDISVMADQDSYQVSLATVAKEFGYKYFWQAMDTFSKRIADSLKDAQSILDGQQKRKLIFSKKSMELVQR
ncbi:MAG: NACHT family-like protein NTPase [uncultured bacterium]|nr:MAG: NACHT family-like protein NTPase [uncultured bacterium]